MKKKFLAIHDGNEIEFHLEKTGDASALLSINGQTIDLDITAVGSKSYSILKDGRSYSVNLTRNKDDVQAVHGGQSVDFKLFDEKKLRRSGGGSVAGGVASGDVTSPMPGKVVKIQVTEGQSVKTGDGIVVVEAMKMENEFKAPRDGVIKVLKVKVGDSVEGGAVLAVVA